MPNFPLISTDAMSTTKRELHGMIIPVPNPPIKKIKEQLLTKQLN